MVGTAYLVAPCRQAFQNKIEDCPVERTIASERLGSPASNINQYCRIFSSSLVTVPNLLNYGYDR